MRVQLLASSRGRRVRALAQALTAAAAMACLAAACIAFDGLRVAASLVGLGTLFWVWRGAGDTDIGQLTVDAGGVVGVLRAERMQAAGVVYCAASFVCFRTPGGRLPLWPDAMAGDAWRRLLVACRWPRQIEAAVPAEMRTK